MPAANLGEVLFSDTKRRILSLLFIDHEKRFYRNEIVNAAAMGVGTVARELENLTLSGILISTKEGKQRYYQANKDCPIYNELRGIVIKTFGVADQIKNALSPLSSKISFALIFGSIAKSSDTSKSDIDVLIISDKLSYLQLMEKLVKLESLLGRAVNPTMYTQNEFVKKHSSKNNFVKQIIKQPKIMLIGNENDLETLTKPRKDRAT